MLEIEIEPSFARVTLGRMNKPADSRFPLLPQISERWSPRAFASTPVSDQQLGSLLEAARWAASCFNEQPWRFFVGRSDSPTHGDIVSTLVPANQAWAKAAPLLMLSVARAGFTRNDKPNQHAWHDTGMASAQLTLQAQSLGLYVHMMAGFDAEVARATFAIPEGYEPVAVLAVGAMGDPATLEEGPRAAETGPRSRKGMGELFFEGTWDQALDL